MNISRNWTQYAMQALEIYGIVSHTNTSFPSLPPYVFTARCYLLKLSILRLNKVHRFWHSYRPTEGGGGDVQNCEYFVTCREMQG
jgi:hypothetical protein